MRNVKARLTAGAGVLVVLTVLQLLYVYEIAQKYAYLGLITTPRPLIAVVSFTVVAVVPVLWLSMHVRRPSALVHWILYLVVIGPAIALSPHSSELTIVELIGMTAALTLSFWLMCSFSRLPVLILKRPEIKPFWFWAGFGVVAVVLLGLVVSTFGFRIRLVALHEVYDLRSSYRDTLEAQGVLVAYAIGWLSNAMGPLLIAVGIHRKNVLVIGLGVALQLLVFSAGGHKTILLSGLFLLCIYIALQGEGRRFVNRFVWGTAGVIIVAFLFDVPVGRLSLTALITRRVFMLPGILTGMYVDFFSENPKTFLSQSVLEGLSEYPYSMSVPNVIGAHYFGRSDMSANANVWADAFANFGFGGIFVFAVLLGLLLWVADSLARTKNWKVACLVVALPAFSLSNSALLTVMLTHGFGVALLLLYLMPPPQDGASHGWVAYSRRKRPARHPFYGAAEGRVRPRITSSRTAIERASDS